MLQQANLVNPEFAQHIIWKLLQSICLLSQLFLLFLPLFNTLSSSHFHLLRMTSLLVSLCLYTLIITQLSFSFSWLKVKAWRFSEEQYFDFFLGFPIIGKVKRELVELLRENGYKTVSEAVGVDHKQWHWFAGSADLFQQLVLDYVLDILEQCLVSMIYWTFGTLRWNFTVLSCSCTFTRYWFI